MSAIVDQYGRPARSRFAQAASNGDGKRPAISVRDTEPLRKLVTYLDWRKISYFADRLFMNFGVVKAAICQKSTFAVGNAWRPVFLGADKGWGRMAAKWLLDEWMPNCDVRGSLYDFQTRLYMDSITMDRSGDAMTLLVHDRERGWPLLQSIPTRQIGQRNSRQTRGRERVTEGRYEGAFIENGVISDRRQRAMAYRLLTEESSETHIDLPAPGMIQIYDPEWAEQSRGFPVFTHAIEEFRDSATSHEWERQAGLIASALGIIETNDEGEGEMDLTDLDTAEEPGGDKRMTAETLDGGLMKYFRAGSGNKLETFFNPRPGADWDQFHDRIIRNALAGMGWPYAMVWKGEGTGTVQRSELLKARNAIEDRQSLLNYSALRKIRFALSVAIEEGLIDPYPEDNFEFLRWSFTRPAKISIDPNNDKKNRRQDYDWSFVNMTDVIAEEGEKTLEEHLEQRADEFALAEQIRIAKEKEHNVELPSLITTNLAREPRTEETEPPPLPPQPNE